jgi:transcriptional regulator with XRE-family HTH domain
MNATTPHAVNDDGVGIAGRIREARLALNLTEEDLANRLGVGPETVTEWESGDRDPRSNRVIMLAGVLGVSAHWLLDGSADVGPAERSEPAEALRAQIESVRMKMGELESLIADMETQLDELDSRA